LAVTRDALSRILSAANSAGMHAAKSHDRDMKKAAGNFKTADAQSAGSAIEPAGARARWRCWLSQQGMHFKSQRLREQTPRCRCGTVTTHVRATFGQAVLANQAVKSRKESLVLVESETCQRSFAC